MIVADASVVIKWFKPEEASAGANRLLNAHLSGSEIIFVPTLLYYEFANALRFSKRLTADEIVRAIALLFDMRLISVNPDRELLTEAISISEKARLSIYDASYLALAKKLNCPLLTADQKLHRSAKEISKIALI